MSSSKHLAYAKEKVIFCVTRKRDNSDPSAFPQSMANAVVASAVCHCSLTQQNQVSIKKEDLYKPNSVG